MVPLTSSSEAIFKSKTGFSFHYKCYPTVCFWNIFIEPSRIASWIIVAEGIITGVDVIQPIHRYQVA